MNEILKKNKKIKMQKNKDKQFVFYKMLILNLLWCVISA